MSSGLVIGCLIKLISTEKSILKLITIGHILVLINPVLDMSR